MAEQGAHSMSWLERLLYTRTCRSRINELDGCIRSPMRRHLHRDSDLSMMEQL